MRSGRPCSITVTGLRKWASLQEKRRTQSLDWMWSMIEEGLREQFHAHAGVKALLPSVLSRVAHGTLAPGAAARGCWMPAANKSAGC